MYEKPSLLRKRSYGFVTQSFLPHERLLQPVATSDRLCFETTNQPSPIVSPLANSNFCKKRSCHPQGNFRKTISVHKLYSFNRVNYSLWFQFMRLLTFMIFHVPIVWHVWMKPPKRSLKANYFVSFVDAH